MCGVFVSTGTQGGGQEVTITNTLSTFVHHGLIYVPLGYKYTFPQLSNLTEIHGGKHISLNDMMARIVLISHRKVLLGEREHLQAQTAPASLRLSKLRSLPCKARDSGRLFPSTTVAQNLRNPVFDV
jgi:hypothetical protein